VEKKCIITDRKEYGDWITANTEEESRAQNKEFREEGRSRTRFEIHEILKNQVAIPRLEAKLRDNDFSTTPERMVLVELSHAKADLKNALKHLHELLYNNENESIRLAANEVYQRSINMTYKERLKEYNIF
jgi:hypothetical protein